MAAMNVFRITGDLSHMLSILLLLKLVFVKKDGRGVSYRSQEIFLLLFLTRYIDLYTTYYSLYNSTAKLFYIFSTAALLIRIKKRNSSDGSTMHDEARDVFPHVSYLVVPCFVLASIYYLVQIGGWNNRNFKTMEMLWTCSIWLESVAIIPQLVLLQKYRNIQPLLAHAILFMGLYRVLYIVNWFYRWQTERWYKHQWGAYAAGIVQVILYADFFYSYLTTKCNNNNNNNNKCSAAAKKTSYYSASSNKSSSSTDSCPNNKNNNPKFATSSSGADCGNVGTEGGGGGGGGGERSIISDDQLTYNPLLQNRICCCDHVAKDEEEGTTTTTTTDDVLMVKNNTNQNDDNNHSAKATAAHGGGVSPPMLIFSCKFVGRLVMVTLSLLFLLVLTAVMLVVHDHFPAVSMALVIVPTLAAIVWGLSKSRKKGRSGSDGGKTNNTSSTSTTAAGECDSKNDNKQTQDGMVASGSDDMERPLLHEK